MGVVVARSQVQMVRHTNGTYVKQTAQYLKAVDSGVELAKYHGRNLGIMSPSHAPYLEVSSSAIDMLDYIVIAFIYAEKKSQDRQKTPSAGSGG
ncbi:hypothetical protein ID866_12032 [Astraeus odoratus]|nr:hypothetical protein ID866_12032 [Astraeus odoratus]